MPAGDPEDSALEIPDDRLVFLFCRAAAAFRAQVRRLRPGTGEVPPFCTVLQRLQLRTGSQQPRVSASQRHMFNLDLARLQVSPCCLRGRRGRPAAAGHAPVLRQF